jgi:branched-chain amino acid transport system permease protein
VDFDFLVQQLVNGVTLGSVYALIALGYTMVYGILKLLNFAHGEVFMIGAFLGLFTLEALGGPLDPKLPLALLLAAMFAVAMVGSGALGLVIERVAYRPLRNAPRIAPLITALGVSFFLQSSAQLLFSADIRSYDTFNLAGGYLSIEGIYWGALNLPLYRILTIGLAVALCIALTVFVARTPTGRAMRATSYDREAAAMMGIDVDRVIAVTFLIGSVLAGAAGVMYGLAYDRTWHFMGFLLGLKGFTAAVIGGIGSIPGAMLGGLLIGLAEALATGYLPQGSTFQDLWVFLLLIVVLLVRPTGLLGRADITKV